MSTAGRNAIHRDHVAMQRWALRNIASTGLQGVGRGLPPEARFLSAAAGGFTRFSGRGSAALGCTLVDGDCVCDID